MVPDSRRRCDGGFLAPSCSASAATAWPPPASSSWRTSTSSLSWALPRCSDTCRTSCGSCATSRPPSPRARPTSSSHRLPGLQPPPRAARPRPRHPGALLHRASGLGVAPQPHETACAEHGPARRHPAVRGGAVHGRRLQRGVRRASAGRSIRARGRPRRVPDGHWRRSGPPGTGSVSRLPVAGGPPPARRLRRRRAGSAAAFPGRPRRRPQRSVPATTYADVPFPSTPMAGRCCTTPGPHW
jgi:hypothetical protein